MSLTSLTAGSNPYQMQFLMHRAVGAYAHDAYTNARKLSSTAIVGASGSINTDVEDYIGQMRWYNTLNPVINTASVSDPTDGTPTELTTAFAKYVKTVRTHGARQVNIQQVVSKEDGLAKIGRDFGETKAQDEHNSVLDTMAGVAGYEIARGIAGSAIHTGGQSLDDPEGANDPDKGFYYYIGSDATTVTPLIDSTKTGATRAAELFNAVGAAFQDYEDPYYYLMCSPRLMAELRVSNLVDDTTVVEGNVEFATIFGGKFRLLMTRARINQSSSNFPTLPTGAEVTFVLKPNTMAMMSLVVPTPVEIERAAAAYQGGGTTDIWYRWGYVMHPMGYDWAGSETRFVPVGSVAGSYNDANSWVRSSMNGLNLGILPIVHG